MIEAGGAGTLHRLSHVRSSPFEPLAPRREAWPAHRIATETRPVRRSLRALLVAGILLLPVWFRAGDVLLGQNFHEVEAGAVYRSGQLTADALGERIEELHLRSVINLRGPGPGKDWYDAEIAASERHGVRHYDISMSARELPRPEELTRLVAVLREAPRPLLVHCKNGSDRSGLASAIALMLDREATPVKAAGEGLSVWYGHMPFGAATAMDRVLELYRQADGFPDFSAWVRDGYAEAYRREAPVRCDQGS